jgi:hypothetical protein
VKLKVKKETEATVDGLSLLRELRPYMSLHMIRDIVNELREIGDITLNPRSDNQAEELALVFVGCGLSVDYID